MSDPGDDWRLQVAGEIHDQLLPYLFASAAVIDTVRRSGELTPGKQKSIDEAAIWLDEARQIARSVLANLDAGTAVAELADLDHPLRSAREFIEPLIQVDATAKRIQWNDLDAVDDQPHSPLVADAIRNIVTESVRNASRHSGADQISVSAWRSPTQYRVEIQDNGIGMNAASIDAASTHGQSLMRHRADAAGIHLETRSVPDEGTKVIAVWNVDDPA